MAIKGGVKTSYKGELLGASYIFSGINNVIDPYNLPIEDGFLSIATNVDIDNTSSISLREGYTSIVSTTDTHSGWSNNSLALFVSDVYLKSFNGTTTTTIDVVTKSLPMWYVQVNDIILYSNGTDFGFVGGENKQVRTYSVDFKETTKFGICLEFYNGRVYHAIENTLYCTDVFDIEHSDVRFKKVATFKDKIVMIKRVEDGLYIGTLNQVLFLAGNDIAEAGFEQRILADYGVIQRTDVATTGEYFPAAKASGQVIVFATTRGICSGASGGSFTNHSVGIVSLPESTNGSALLRDKNGTRQYIVSMFGSGTAYNLYPQNTFEVNELTN